MAPAVLQAHGRVSAGRHCAATRYVCLDINNEGSEGRSGGKEQRRSPDQAQAGGGVDMGCGLGKIGRRGEQVGERGEVVVGKAGLELRPRVLVRAPELAKGLAHRLLDRHRVHHLPRCLLSDNSHPLYHLVCRGLPRVLTEALEACLGVREV